MNAYLCIHRYVYRLVKQGVLTLKESEHMFESIAEDELALEQARKNQVSSFNNSILLTCTAHKTWRQRENESEEL